MSARNVGGRSIGRREGRAVLRAGVAGLFLAAMGSGPSLAQGGGVGGTSMREKPSGSNGLTASPGSGIPSEPPGRAITGTQTGGMASSGTQGTSGGNNESGGGKGMPGPTGSGSPGSGPGSSPPRISK